MRFDGTRVSYWRSRPSDQPDAPAVLLLHGLAADHEGLRPLAAQLPTSDVVAVDLPGFGRSEALRGPHTLGAYAQVVDALCDHLGWSEVAVVGHSLGATIALSHASAYPQRVRSLAMLMPVTIGTGPSTWLPRAYYLVGSWLPAPIARAWFLSRAAVYVADKMTLVTADVPVRRRILREDFRTAALASPRAIQEIYRSMRATEFLALADRVSAPSLIVGAERDGLVPPRVLTALHARIPGSDLVFIPGAGHLWPVEYPAHAATTIALALRGASLNRGVG